MWLRRFLDRVDPSCSRHRTGAVDFVFLVVQQLVLFHDALDGVVDTERHWLVRESSETFHGSVREVSAPECQHALLCHDAPEAVHDARVLRSLPRENLRVDASALSKSNRWRLLKLIEIK